MANLTPLSRALAATLLYSCSAAPIRNHATAEAQFREAETALFLHLLARTSASPDLPRFVQVGRADGPHDPHPTVLADLAAAGFAVEPASASVEARVGPDGFFTEVRHAKTGTPGIIVFIGKGTCSLSNCTFDAGFHRGGTSGSQSTYTVSRRDGAWRVTSVSDDTVWW